MEKNNKLLKILIVANGFILLASFIFCFQNCDMSKTGYCSECDPYANLPFEIGLLIALIQIMLAVFMYRRIRERRSEDGYKSMKRLAVFSTILAFMQIFVFGNAPDISTHDEFSDIEAFIVAMYDVQFIVQKIASSIIVVINILVAIFATKGLKLLEEEIKQLEKNAIEHRNDISI